MGLTTPPTLTENRRLTRNNIKQFENVESRATVKSGSTEEKDFPKQETNSNQITALLGRRTRHNAKKFEQDSF
jgi:hypothetical protein